MSRTDKTDPWEVRSRYADDREEVHVWCENETIDNARYSWRHHGRAVYERYVVKTEWRYMQMVAMVDSNGVKFKARIGYTTRSNPDGLYYDREEHPNAEYIYDHARYGGELWKVRRFSRQWVEFPIYRHRLVHWEFEPRRECDIDDPKGQCHYESYSLRYPHKHNRELRRIAEDKPRRRKERDALNYAKHEYNTFGYTEHEPPPKVPSNAWW